MSAVEEYRAPAREARFELREKGSRFLAIVEPVGSVGVARERVRRRRQEFAQATHVCWAWRIGSTGEEGRSDAGEPAGTAGEPMLQVLRGAEMADVVAVAVRWFGGTKLGKGGLARAYAAAVKGALEDLEVVTRRPVTRLRIELPYDRLGDLRRLVQPPAVVIVEESYGSGVEIVLEIERQRVAELEEHLHGFALSIEPAGN